MIQLSHVERRFLVGDETVHALDDVSLQIAAGDYLALMGPSGSGKSSLLNILGLLDRPNSGSYRLDGAETTGLGEEARAALRSHYIGFVFQAFHLIPRLNAAENIELPLTLAGVPSTERRHRVDQVIDSLGMRERAHHRPDQLSGGQRQRVAIGRAMVMQPRLLLADEPTGNLDKRSGSEVVELLEALNTQGITLIVVTHDPAIGARARRHIQMIDGRIVGSP